MNIEQQEIRNITELPNNWWQMVRITNLFTKSFERSILGLLLAVWKGAEFEYSVYSGILLGYRGKLIWITAGHVIDEINQIMASSSLRIDLLCWLDGYKVKGAEGVRFHRMDPIMSSWKHEGTDIGLIIVSDLDAGNLLQNERIMPFSTSIWDYPNTSSIVGHYAVGYPRVWSTHEKTKISQRQLIHKVSSSLVCLPLERIKWESQLLDNEIWRKENAIIGRILKYPENPEFSLEKLQGISGGPIFTLLHTEDTRISYRLAGIVCECNAQQTILCGESLVDFITTILEYLDRNILME
jgi:hypothetical protein